MTVVALYKAKEELFSKEFLWNAFGSRNMKY